MEIKYVCSNGKEYSLVGDRMRVTSGGFHKYQWKAKTKQSEFGEEVYGFTKDSLTYEMTLTIRGTLEERKEYLNEIRNAFEYDILCVTPGSICFGKYSIDAYIVSSETQTSDILNCWSKNDIEIYCPYPFWIGENLYEFKSFAISSTGNKKYPGRYAYRYENGMSSNYIINPHFAPSNFEMFIYGHVVNPMVIIGDSTYLVNIIIEDGEYLYINTRTRRIIKVLRNGEQVDAFHNRQKGKVFFEKIQPGRQKITWTGNFSFDLIIYEERSEPKW